MSTNKTATEKRDVSSFNTLKLRDDSGGAAVYIQQGSSEGLHIEASPELLRRIVSDVHNGTLYVRLGGSWLERLGDKLTTSLTRPRITYRLQVKDIQALELLCASTVHIPSLKTGALRLNLNGFVHANIHGLEAERLTLQHSGMGKLQFEGTVGSQDVSLNGAGVYSAHGLCSEQAVIRISGSAQALVYATASLDATIRGMGVVEYRGTPRVRQQIFGMGSVIHEG
jgi:hypothetical protein